ncbi:MAG: universal stress protein [Deltaproteobacteria bacterium]|nr:universal stress protein [Deltaproteobacteria bacterium]MDZ4342717.1 universal stress protein [Candidatus Binatia bacterium]
MYTRMLIPLDGSTVAEQVLPYARFLAKGLAIPVDLLEVVDADAVKLLADPEQGRYIDTVLAEKMHSCQSYLNTIARSFDGSQVKSFVAIGKAEEIIIEKAGGEANTLIVMATHGRSGIQRWLLGSVAEKVLNGADNHLLLVRATEPGKTDGKAALKTVVVALDGSSLAEKVLPHVVDLAKKMKLKVVFIRAYALPSSITAEEYGNHQTDLIDHIAWEARDYLEKKIREVKEQGLVDVEPVVKFGSGAEEIIALGRDTPDNFIAMCTHGSSGIGRWFLGSVTQRVVQHSGDPVLIVRAS